MTKNLFRVIIIFALISIVFCAPIFENPGNWGQRDWDEAFFWNGLARKTMLEYKQFPLWNPYSRGGMEFLGYPHSTFVSPMFLFVLLCGVNAGLKVQIVIYLFLGLIGMYVLSRSLRLSRVSACLSAFVYSLSSIYAFHLSEGHIGWMAMELLPLFFFAYLKSVKNRSWIIISAAIFSLFLACGSVDVTAITLVFLAVYSVLFSLREKNVFPIGKMFAVFLCSGLLLAFKLVPMLRFLTTYSREINEIDGIGLSRVMEMLLSREQLGLYLVPFHERIMTYGWHEYGAYIGVIPLVLSIIGVFGYFKRHWPLACTGLICLLVAMGNKSVIPVWHLLSRLPIYDSLRVPSRYILGVIFCIAIFSGMGLEFLKKRVKIKTIPKADCIKKVAFYGLLFFVMGDLFIVNSPIFKKAFLFPSKHIEASDRFTQSRSDLIWTEQRWNDLYPSFLANRGTLNSNEIMPIQSKALASGDLNYKGEVYLANGNGRAYIQSFSPNNVFVKVKATQDDILILNQNYYRGWKAIKKDQLCLAANYNGLISSEINPGIHEITFVFQPDDFKIGLLISIMTIVGICIFLMLELVSIHRKNNF